MTKTDEKYKWKVGDYVAVAIVIYVLCGFTYLALKDKKRPVSPTVFQSLDQEALSVCEDMVGAELVADAYECAADLVKKWKNND